MNKHLTDRPAHRGVHPRVVLAVVACLTLTGCATTTPQAPTTASAPSAGNRPAVDAAMLRPPGTTVDFQPYPSVAAAVDASTYAVTGTITRWLPGRTVAAEDDGALDRSLFAVLEVSVTSDHGQTAAPQTLEVEVRRGQDTADSEGRQTTDEDERGFMYRTVDELQAAAPPGTRVVVIATAAPSTKQLEGEGNLVDVPTEGARPDVTLVRPLPQGLLLEAADGTLVSGVGELPDVLVGDWPGAQDPTHATFDALLAALGAHH